jgi:hypothetical protein
MSVTDTAPKDHEQLKNDQQLLPVMLSHHLTHNISDEKGKEVTNLE